MWGLHLKTGKMWGTEFSDLVCGGDYSNVKIGFHFFILIFPLYRPNLDAVELKNASIMFDYRANFHRIELCNYVCVL